MAEPPRELTEADFDPQLWEDSMEQTLEGALDGGAHEQALVGYALGRGWEGAEPDWDEAVKWYTLAAKQGNAGAMFVIGVCHAKGRGVDQDWANAFRFFRAAAQREDVNGMFQTAWCYLNEKGAPHDLEQAQQWCEAAAQNGHGNAAKMLTMIEEEAAQRADPAQPRKLGEADFDPQLWEDSHQAALQRAEAGGAHDQALIGYALGLGAEGIEPDWEEAVKWYGLSAEQGNGGALYVLGVCNAKGRGVDQDWEAAFGLFKGSAERDDVNGMFQTAWCYLNGKGAVVNLDQATFWCEKASRNGHASAGKMLAAIRDAAALQSAATASESDAESVTESESSVGSAQYTKDGTRVLGERDFDPELWDESMRLVLPKALASSAHDQNLVGYALSRGWERAAPDWEEAVKWYGMAAAQGHAGATLVLGVCHAKGRGIEQDWEAAFGHFLAAAEGDDVNAMCQTGWCYMNGMGTDQDLAQAMHWCSEATERGHAKAARMVAAIRQSQAADKPRRLGEADFDPQLWQESMRATLPRALDGSAHDQ